MKIEAHRLSGLGNTILLVDLIRQPGEINSPHIKKIVDESKINFDQLITIEPPKEPQVDLSVQIFNNDGSKAKNCINGARCLTKYVSDSGLIPQKKFSVNTDGGIWQLSDNQDGSFSVEMPPPNFTQGQESLPTMNSNKKYVLEVDDISLEIALINIGNPHAVHYLEDIVNFPLTSIGIKLQDSSWFPDGINFGVAKVNSTNNIDLRVYERGAGETLACGSGACAAVVAGCHEGLLDDDVEVNFKKGKLNISYKKHSGTLIARGGADYLDNLSLEI
jgi:diaminopimelate epimerase